MLITPCTLHFLAALFPDQIDHEYNDGNKHKSHRIIDKDIPIGETRMTKIRKDNASMIMLNDYLYNGDTVVKILHCYARDLKESAIVNSNGVDLAHSNCLLQMIELLEHNDFLTGQSQKIREFYKYMADRYPFLAFTFKGRIKSLIRLEEKINGKIVGYIYDYRQKMQPIIDEQAKRIAEKDKRIAELEAMLAVK